MCIYHVETCFSQEIFPPPSVIVTLSYKNFLISLILPKSLISLITNPKMKNLNKQKEESFITSNLSLPMLLSWVLFISLKLAAFLVFLLCSLTPTPSSLLFFFSPMQLLSPKVTSLCGKNASLS